MAKGRPIIITVAIAARARKCLKIAQRAPSATTASAESAGSRQNLIKQSDSELDATLSLQSVM